MSSEESAAAEAQRPLTIEEKNMIANQCGSMVTQLCQEDTLAVVDVLGMAFANVYAHLCYGSKLDPVEHWKKAGSSQMENLVHLFYEALKEAENEVDKPQ